ncbi:MAG: hypothetical protein LBU31_02005 [Coriobacteriales bacterium]|jgi:hypothetical protein|nr:hypothetical protein [Coriobacteriales bacterium]
MRKKIGIALLAALVSLVMAGMVIGCTQGAVSGSDVVEIQRFKQTTSGLEITNYQVVFKQTPEEWNALSSEDKEELAKVGFDQAIEKMKADGVSNYNITASTVLGPMPNGIDNSQLAFFLDRENSLLQIYSEPDAEGRPHIVAEVPVTLP